MRYAVVIEKADGNYSAYVPDLPGCVATGATAKPSRRRSERHPFHIEGLRPTRISSERAPVAAPGTRVGD